MSADTDRWVESVFERYDTDADTRDAWERDEIERRRLVENRRQFHALCDRLFPEATP